MFGPVQKSTGLASVSTEVESEDRDGPVLSPDCNYNSGKPRESLTDDWIIRQDGERCWLTRGDSRRKLMHGKYERATWDWDVEPGGLTAAAANEHHPVPAALTRVPAPQRRVPGLAGANLLVTAVSTVPVSS
ncbi:hypothetical protein JX265_004504 [Neoarthrinium moseri]|uniref:Uncharacterized protein n=1 Tax=Neoarthrinium moseri TaxID=1658444 RepID=A0A9P9WQV2_9PEZI|nr:hypothetical protein JX265_004504 [Neoarthrinium moseri]